MLEWLNFIIANFIDLKSASFIKDLTEIKCNHQKGYSW